MFYLFSFKMTIEQGDKRKLTKNFYSQTCAALIPIKTWEFTTEKPEKIPRCYIDYGATARVDFFCLHTHGSILIHGARHKRPSEFFKIKLKHFSKKCSVCFWKPCELRGKLWVKNGFLLFSFQNSFWGPLHTVCRL